VSLDYKELPPRNVGRTMQTTGATCDVCGNNAWHSAHKRPVATLGRVEDGNKGNMGWWELDLCTACKDVVMVALRLRADFFERVIPDTREERFER